MKRLTIMLLSLFIFACDSGEDEGPDQIDIEAIILDANAEFIYFDDDNTQYYYPTEFVLPDFSNTYLNTGNQDQLNLNMQVEGGQYQCNIFVNGLELGTRSFPITITQFDDLPGHAEIQLIDQFNQPAIQFGPEDDLNYVASSIMGDFILTIEAMNDEEISGTFSGKIKTRANSSKFINLDNGRFRVKLN